MNVLVTRPDERGQQLVKALAEQQIFALHQPLFRVEAGRELPLLPALLSSLNVDDYLFIVSKNAVDFAHQTLVDTGFSWRGDICYFSVGGGTASYFASQTGQAVRYPFNMTTSEGLLALPEMQALTGKTVLILRAESGREFFAEQIQLRGATVKMLECYQRVPLGEDLGEKISLAKRAGIDTIVATSSEILAMLKEKTLEADRQWIVDCRLVVVSQRIRETALQFGWQAKNIYISPKADNTSLLNTLLEISTLK